MHRVPFRSLAAVLVVAFAGTSQASPFSVDVTNSYLDNVGNLSNTATVIDLSAAAVVPGDRVLLEALGEFSLAGSETLSSAPLTSEMIGVFSSSDTLLPINIVTPGLRVSGAVDAGIDVVTDTDIPQDFFIGQTLIEIPAGATHLFVAPLDGFVGDNADDNNNFAVAITPIPEPTAAALLLLATAIVVVRSANLRKQNSRANSPSRVQA